jgi:hypothetical protein
VGVLLVADLGPQPRKLVAMRSIDAQTITESMR